MNIAQLDQHLNFKAPSGQGHAHRLVRNGCWIILGVFVPISIWMTFAVLCSVILVETIANFDKVLQQQAHLIFAEKTA